MRSNTRRTWRTYTATLVTICLFPLLGMWIRIPQPWSLASLGVLCLLGSFRWTWFLRAEEGSRQVAIQRSDTKAKSRVEVSNRSRGASSVPTALRPLPIVNAFSIDLEEYFHTEVARKVVPAGAWDVMPSCIERSTTELLDILDRTETQATVFVLGWVARKNPELVRHIYDRGHEIACHSNRHTRVSALTPSEFLEDTKVALNSIQDACGARVQGYRAPSFSITEGTEWAFNILADLGFTYDSSVNPVYHPTYGNPNAMRFPYYVADCKLLEIPIATWRLGGVNLPVGGGAYLRLLPERYIHAGMRAINHLDREPAMLYVHPWEIDPIQPRLKLTTLSQLRQTSGLQTTAAKLERLLRSYQFAPVTQVYSHLIPQWHAELLHQPSLPVVEVTAG